MTGTDPIVNPLTEGKNFGFRFTEKKSWPEHDLHSYNVFHGSRPTNLQAIVYKGNFVTFRSKDYYVFPHEDLFAEIHPVMEELGGKIQYSGVQNKSFSMVYGKNHKAELEANYKYFNGKKYYIATQVRANYVFDDEKFDVTGKGDVVKFGTTIENAIDGTMSMRISPYSFRQICSNGMMHMQSVVQISENILQNMMRKHQTVENAPLIQKHMEQVMQDSKSFDDLITKIKKDRMTHMTKIPVEWIRSRIYLIKESVDLFKQRYREMTELFVTQQQAESIAARLPKRLTDALEWIEVKEEEQDVKVEGKTIKQMRRSVKLDQTKQWKAFNDITENLTHVERAFQSKAYAYKQLDKILVIANE